MTKCAMITGVDYSREGVTTCQDKGTVQKGKLLFCELHADHISKEWVRDTSKDGSFKYVNINT